MRYLGSSSWAMAILAGLAGPVQAQTVVFKGIELATATNGAGAIAMNGDALQMMDLTLWSARSAISTSTYNLNGAWTSRFQMDYGCPPGTVACPGDGIGFVVTNGPTGQLGMLGGWLGYVDSFSSSYGVFFQSVYADVRLGRNGGFEGGGLTGGPQWYPGWNTVDVSYDGAGTFSFSVNNGLVSGSLGGLEATDWSHARVGFTTGSGSWSAVSQVTDWTWNVAPNSANEPPSTTVPEPGTAVMLLSGLVGLFLVDRRCGPLA